jgi:hypothetical protein
VHPLRSPVHYRTVAACFTASAVFVALVPGLSLADDLAPAARSMGPTAPPNGFVIHIGDSFVDAGLQQALRPKFHEMGTKYLSFARTSSWLSTWAASPEIDNLYFGYRPALFLVTLGANELFAKPADRRAPLVRAIVRRFRGTPCVWISIPVWEGAPTDLVEMTRRESAPCRHFDSSEVGARMTRQRDKRHPDTAGGAMWADAFWEWLMKERDPDRGFWALKPAPPEEHGPPAGTAQEP